MTPRVALVTGGSRGIGFEVCKQLCQKLNNTDAVILTARSEEAGLQACKVLEREGHCNARFVQLDVTCDSSIKNVTKRIREDFNGLDILINNAAILFSPSKSKNIPYEEQVEKTIQTNFFGVLNVYESLESLLKPNARVVNITSRLGKTDIFGEELRAKFENELLNKEDLIKLLQQYISEVKEKRHVSRGWPEQDQKSWMSAAYSVSKIAVTILTHILAKERKHPDTLVNCCCPGWVKTSLGGPYAPKSAEEGAAAILECAFLADAQSSGGYFQDGKLQMPFYEIK